MVALQISFKSLGLTSKHPFCLPWVPLCLKGLLQKTETSSGQSGWRISVIPLETVLERENTELQLAVYSLAFANQQWVHLAECGSTTSKGSRGEPACCSCPCLSACTPAPPLGWAGCFLPKVIQWGRRTEPIINTFPYTRCNYGHWAVSRTSSQAYSPKGKVCVFVPKCKWEWQSFQSCFWAAPMPVVPPCPRSLSASSASTISTS